MRLRGALVALAVASTLPLACTFFTSLDDLTGGTRPGDAGAGVDSSVPADSGEEPDATEGDTGAPPGVDATVDATPESDAAEPDAAAPDAAARDAAVDAAPDAAPDAGPSGYLATGRSSPKGLTVAGSYVYWVEQGTESIWRAPKAGGAAARVDVVADAVADPFDVAVTATTLFWTERSGATIASRPLAGGTRKDLKTTGASLLAYLAVDSAGTAFASDDVTSVSTSGHVYVDGADAGGLFTTQSAIVSGVDVRAGEVIFAQATYHAILQAPETSGAGYQYLGYTGGDVAGLAFDGNDVYYLEDQRSIMKMDSAGSPSLLLDLGAAVGDGDVATDGVYVYWTEPSRGNVRRTLIH